MQTKSLREDVPEVRPKHVADDARWIKKVIEEEHMKSLQVSKDYVLAFEAKEADQHDRQEAAIEKHVDTLGKLRERLESKVELKKTTNEYREFQREFSKKKWAIMKGMTLEDLEANEADGGGPETVGPSGVDQQRIPEASDLTNILENLNKLARLEKRITSLESNNEYEKMTKHQRTPAQERTSFEFKRKREVAQRGGAKQIVYTIKPKRTQFGSSSGGSGVNAVRGSRGGNTTGAGTFLTGGDFGGEDTGGRKRVMTREERARERQRALHDATPGQKAMRGRLQARKAKAREAAAGVQRHQQAMDELARRKRDQGSRAKAKQWGNRINSNKTSSRATKGASAGIKTKNKHMQDFQRAKNAHAKRREDLKKTTLNRVNTKMKGKISQFGGGLGSRTAPVGGGGGSRGPSVSKRGTNTRRLSGGTAPARRARTGGAEMPIPGAIAVKGIGGLRALRGQKGGPSKPVRGRPPNNNRRGY